MSITIDSLAPARSPRAGLSASPKFLSRLPKSLKSIAVSVAPGDSTEVRRYGIIGGRHDDVLKVAKKRQAAHPRATLKFCYEAGPRGYPLCRFLRAHGHDCIVVCPSRVPRRPGDRPRCARMTNGQSQRANRARRISYCSFAEGAVPDPQDEALRDFPRTRHQIVRAQHRARQQLKMFLLRQNIRYAGGKPWTPKHLHFLGTIKPELRGETCAGNGARGSGPLWTPATPSATRTKRVAATSHGIPLRGGWSKRAGDPRAGTQPPRPRVHPRQRFVRQLQSSG